MVYSTVPGLFLPPHGLPLLVGAASGGRAGHAPPDDGRPQHASHVVAAVLVIRVDIGFAAAVLAPVVFVSLSVRQTDRLLSADVQRCPTAASA